MREQELISVVIPTCRRDARIVKRAVDSALGQTRREIELIVVDDSPAAYPGRDGVAKMMKALGDPRARYVRHERNLGACAARNTGIAQSSGRYVAFLDDDDEWLPEKLEKQLAKFDALGDEYGLIGCGSVTVDDRSGRRTQRRQKCARGRVFDRLILENFIGSTSFPLIRRSCFDECGPFDALMQSAQDYEMWLRIAARYAIDFVDEPLVLYHVNGDERISTNVGRRIQGLERLSELHAEYLSRHPAALSARLMKLVPHYIRSGDRRRAWRAYARAARLSPFQVRGNLKGLLSFLRRESHGRGARPGEG